MADQAISQLPLAAPLSGNELTVVVQNGITVQTQVDTLNLQAGYNRMATVVDAPTDIPEVQPGNVPFVYDVVNNKIYVYNEGWHSFSQD